MDGTDEPTGEIVWICAEGNSWFSVDMLSSDAAKSGSARSCTPSLSTKKLIFPTVTSKPESSPAKVSCASVEYGVILFGETIFADEIGELSPVDPMFAEVADERSLAGAIGEPPFVDEVGELPCVDAIGELPSDDEADETVNPTLPFPTDGAN